MKTKPLPQCAQWLVIATCLLFQFSFASSQTQISPHPQKRLKATVSIFPDKQLNEFRPDSALGAGVDGMEKGDIAKVYTKKNRMKICFAM